MSLTRETILASDDLYREELAIPEWGGSVWIRTLSGKEYKDLKVHLEADDGTRMAQVAIVCAVDEHGQQLFNPGDAEELSSKSGSALRRILNKALTVNRLTDDADVGN